MRVNVFDKWQILVPSNDWLWLISLSCFICLVISYGTYQKVVCIGGHSKRRFIYLSLINVVVMLLFFLLVLPIANIKSKALDVVLLTYGINQQQVDSLIPDSIETAYLLADENRFDDISFTALDKKLIVINTIEQLPVKENHISHLTIYGDGLTATQIARLPHVSLTFFPSEKLTGLIDVTWQETLNLGHPLIIKGRYQQTTIAHAGNSVQKENISEVALFDPFDNKLVSLKLTAGENFTLQVQPKVRGQFIYRIKLIDNLGKIITNEPVAISVEKPALANILIKQSSPSFETRQLKKWAAEQQAMVVVQTRISQDKVISKYTNVSDNSSLSKVQAVDFQSLTHFDLLVIDGRGLLALDENEASALLEAIKNGLGIYVIVDTSLIRAFESKNTIDKKLLVLDELLKNFTLLVEESKNYPKTSQLFWQNGQTSLPIHLSQAQLNIRHGENLIVGDKQQIIVASKNKGIGKITLSLFNQSFSLMTQHEPLVYSQLWQFIIENTARVNQSAYWLTTNNISLRQINEPSLLCALNEQTYFDHNREHLSSPQFVLNMTIDDKDKYCGYIWPKGKGWQSFDLLNNDGIVIDKHWLYSYTGLNWAAWQQTDKHKATAQAALFSKSRERISRPAPTDKKTIWLMLFISLSVLWLEHKKR